MEQLVKTMMQLIKNEVCKHPLDDLGQDILSAEFFEKLYHVSKSQDLAHLVGAALVNNGLLPEGEIGKKFEKQMFSAVYRYQRLNYEYMRLCDTLETAKIDYMPLKGSIIREYYPESWMRTSCDIDILVHEEDLDRAVQALCDTLEYRAEGERYYHDISLYSPSGIHLELHFNILEHIEQIDGLLSRVWEFSKPIKGKQYAYRQTNEYLVFHCLAHMSYHFVKGGCGIRPFMDLHLLRTKMGYDEKKVRGFCRECGLERFYDSVLALSQVWFNQEKHSHITANMEEYLLTGGIYGSHQNVITLAQEKKGGRRNYILFRIFMPYRDLKLQYPVLERHKWLLPICHIRRWGRLLFCGRFKKSVKELKITKNVDTEKGRTFNDLFKELGF